jgi:Predicted ATPase of the ABC class
VAKEKEPITPFISKIRALAARHVSCILVIGGSGDYFDVADTVIAMDSYRAKDVTEEAHAIAQRFGPSVSAVRARTVCMSIRLSIRMSVRMSACAGQPRCVPTTIADGCSILRPALACLVVCSRPQSMLGSELSDPVCVRACTSLIQPHLHLCSHCSGLSLLPMLCWQPAHDQASCDQSRQERLSCAMLCTNRRQRRHRTAASHAACPSPSTRARRAAGGAT